MWEFILLFSISWGRESFQFCFWTELIFFHYLSNYFVKEVFYRITKQSPGSTWLNLAFDIDNLAPDWKATTHCLTLPDTSCYAQKKWEWFLKGVKSLRQCPQEGRRNWGTVSHAWSFVKLCQYITVCGPSLAQLDWENRATRASGSNLRGCHNVG